MADYVVDLDRPLVGTSPAGDLVEVAPDAYNLDRRHSPCPPALHGPAKQRQERDPTGCGLLTGSNPNITVPYLNRIAKYTCSITDDVFRNVYVHGKYRNMILPMTVRRQTRRISGAHQAAVLGIKATLNATGMANQGAALRQPAEQAFHSASKSPLRDLQARARSEELRTNFVDNFRNQIPCLDQANLPVWGVKAFQVFQGVGW